MGHDINNLVQRNVCTPDQGGSITTSAYVSAVLQEFKSLYNQSTFDQPTQTPSIEPSTNLNRGPKSLISDLQAGLLVIDFQNDFAASINDSSPSLSSLTGNIARLLSHIRSAQSNSARDKSQIPALNMQSVKDVKIIHVRFFGDSSHQSAPWASRNKYYCTPNRCLFGTEGANFVETVAPRDTEPVFEKWSSFDPFMVTGFEAYLQEKGIQHLILVGLYGDVCVDTTDRSAFQKGYWVSVISGCIGNLHLDLKNWEDFACKVYGAKMLEVENFAHLPGTELNEAGGRNWMKAKLV